MKNNFVAEGAKIIGDVVLGDNVSIWYNAVLRGDVANITIGDGSNVQDNCVVHCQEGLPVVLGNGVSIGHGAILHSCQIGDNSLVGMGAIVLDGAKVGKNCIIGAGAVVTKGSVLQDNGMYLGCPAKFVRYLTDDEIAGNQQNALHYIQSIFK